VVAALAAQVTLSGTPEFVVDERDERGQDLLPAGAQLGEESGDVPGRAHRL
jgi:hypothetical protein